MNKNEIISAIAEKSGLTKAQAETAFNVTFDLITELMVKQEKVMVPGFGGFSTKVRAERKGRNPSTGQEMTIPQAVVANFKPSIQLKDAVNNKSK